MQIFVHANIKPLDMTNHKNEDYKPLVSIIMSCFNGEKYLSRALESIIDQEYHNWELIFWDNQSNDNSSIIFKNIMIKGLNIFMLKPYLCL